MTGRRAPNWLTLANRLNRPLLRRGIGPYLLLVAGRKSGVVRSTPIAVLEQDGDRYLVAGFDGADWIRNVRRQGGQAELQRGARAAMTGSRCGHERLAGIPRAKARPKARPSSRTHVTSERGECPPASDARGDRRD